MASDVVPDDWVRLNVGGRMFITMKQTLRVSPFFARLFASDDRMPDANAPTHFVDRDPDRFAKVLNYLRDGSLFADKNCNLEELRREADFYGLDELVKTINAKAAQNECVVVTSKDNQSGEKWIEVAVNSRDDDHFLLRHLQQRYPCRVRAPSFQFPYGLTFELRGCSACRVCMYRNYDFYHERDHYGEPHGCVCAPNAADAMLTDVVSTLESRGYVMDRGIDAVFTAAGRLPGVYPKFSLPTSWTFIKRERGCQCFK